MEERSTQIETQQMEEETKLPEASNTKSFKQALTETKNNEKAFDNDLDRLSTDDEFLTDEENNGAGSDEEQETGFNLRIPKIKLPPRLIAAIRKPWKDCLIVRLLGKTVGFKILVHRLKKLWGLQGDFEATDLGLGFFLIKFEMLADCNSVYTEGPWIIMDHYLTVRRWEHDFKPSKATEVTTALWVRFPQLPIEYYNEKVLYHIAKVIGRPLKVDLNTAMSIRGRYARVCVEVDLTKPLVSRFAIGKYSYTIEYEHLHYFCFACGKVGHRKEYCNVKGATPPPLSPARQGDSNGPQVRPEQGPTASASGAKPHLNQQEEAEFGPWMLVTRRTRKPIGNNRAEGAHMHHKPNNRFGPLANKTRMAGTRDKLKGKEVQGTHINVIHNTGTAPKNPVSGLEASSSMANTTEIHPYQVVQDTSTQMQVSHVKPMSVSEPRPATGSEIVADSLMSELVPNFAPPSSTPILPSSPLPSNTVITQPLPPPENHSLAIQISPKQHPPDFEHERELQQHKRQLHQYRNGDAGSANIQDDAQCGGVISRTRERSNSPSKHRLVDRRNSPEHRAQMAERGRKTSSGNSDGSPASIYTE
ncbi:hypothetical protein ACSBR1_034273 [Camellia fascicularis]